MHETVSVSIDSGFRKLITSSTSDSGVEAPDVIPTVLISVNHSRLMLFASFIKYEGTPESSATSLSLLQLELFSWILMF